MRRWPIVLLLLGQVACATTARRGEPFTGPVASEDARVARGRVVFMTHCNHCHPGGEAGLGPSLHDKPLPDFLITTQVRHGLGAMPAFGPEVLGDPDLDTLLAYLAATKARKPDPARVSPRPPR